MRQVAVFPHAGTLPAHLEGLSCPRLVVVDVLRATSVIAVALAAGARAVEPCLTPADAEAAAARRISETPPPLRAGERGGLCLPGFDLGNSPAEYTPERVAGRVLCFTTSNGTRALLEAAPHGEVLCASFLNRGAVVRHLRAHEGDVCILCAGTGGGFSADDLGVAGALVSALRGGSPGLTVDDLGAVAEHWFEGHRDALPAMLGATSHGRHLATLGFASDLDHCGRLDRLDVVPRFSGGLVTLR